MQHEAKRTSTREKEVQAAPKPKKPFVEPKLERHETLPDVTGFTF